MGSTPDNVTLIIAKSIFHQQYLNVLNVLIYPYLKRSLGTLHVLYLGASSLLRLLFDVHVYDRLF